MFTYLLGSGDIDVAKHIARLSAGETATNIAAVTALILGLKADRDLFYSTSVWDRISVLCVVHNIESNSLLNLKGDSSGAPDSITRNSPIFTANRGFLSKSGFPVEYIELGISADALDLYELYSTHSFLYTRTFNATGTIPRWADWGTWPGGLLWMNFKVTTSPDETYLISQVSTGGAGDMIIVQDNPMGFIGMSSINVTTRHGRLNDTTVSNGVFDSASVDFGAGGNLFVGTNVDEQFAAWGAGAALSPTALGLYEDRIRTYMQAIGADVY